jgi:hypothetical protein
MSDRRSPGTLRAAQMAAAASLCLLARLARAEPTPATARLVFEQNVRREDCPDERAFRTLVTARLGKDPFSEQGLGSVHVTLGTEGAGILGRVSTTGGGGARRRERSVRGSMQECEAVVEALASVVALHLAPPQGDEPQQDLPPLPVAPSLPSSGTPVPREDVDARSLPASKDEEREPHAVPVRFAARAALVGGLGLLPGASLGGEVGAGVRRGAFGLFATGRGETQAGEALGTQGERLDGSLFTVGVLPCFVASWFAACGSASVGKLQGRAPEAATPSLGSSTVAYAGARIGAEVPLGAGLRLAPHVELTVPLVRTTLLYAQSPAWVAPALAGSLGFGLVYVAE